MNCFIVVLTMLACLGGQGRLAPGDDDPERLAEQAFQTAVERVAPSVVRIETIGGREQVGRVLFGAGPTTGLVVDAEGYVVSSAFNFLDEPASILVEVPGEGRKPAQLVATDHNRMIVLLKIEVDRPLAVPEFAPQGQVEVGQWSIAVGRTFEADRPNVAVGIVSAVNRIWGKAIQTDAAVSPNNYGGPLVDVRGRVLGVLVPMSPATAQEIAGVEWYDSGIGFAVPGDNILAVVSRLKEGVDLYPGVIGIGFSKRSLPVAEPVIAAVRPNSPAYKAGLKAADRIVQAEGRKIVWAAQVKEEISKRYAGETIHLVVIRDKQRVECDVELAAKLEPYEHPFLGVLPMRDVPTAAGRKASGVAVRYVFADGPAAKAGIKPGDVLVRFAGEPIASDNQCRLGVSQRQPEEEVEIEVRRGEESLKFTVRLGRLPEEVPSGPLPKARVADPSDTNERPQVGRVALKIPELENGAAAYVPADYHPAVPHGVVVWLHGAGEFDEQEWIARWKPHCDRHGLILLVPKAADPNRWQPSDLKPVVKLLEEVTSICTVDPTRIVVHGREGGGTLAYLLAFGNRELIRAVATIDAPMVRRPPDNDPVHRLAFYIGKSQKGRFTERIEGAVRQLRAMKYPVIVHDLGPEPHELEADELTDLVRWIDTLDRI